MKEDHLPFEEAVQSTVQEQREILSSIHTEKNQLADTVVAQVNKWMQNVSAASLAIGVAIIPITISTSDKLDVNDKNLLVLGGLIFIVNGLALLFLDKRRIERNVGVSELAGLREQAILNEQIEAGENYLNKQISIKNYTRLLKEKFSESNPLIDIFKDSDRVNFATDAHFGALSLGVALIISVAIPNEYLIAYVILVILGLAIIIIDAVKSALTINKLRTLKKGYLARMDAIDRRKDEFTRQQFESISNNSDYN